MFVSELQGKRIGSYSLQGLPDGDVELGHLFVDLASIGTGIGWRLVRHAYAKASELGFSRIVIQSDPNAEGFYLRYGGRRIGSRESGSFPGRMLSLFEVALDTIESRQDGGWR